MPEQKGCLWGHRFECGVRIVDTKDGPGVILMFAKTAEPT